MTPRRTARQRTHSEPWNDPTCRTRSSVLANPRNQGYGGNQKMGYQYAIAERFDVVVMVHGDGQYPPEAVADLARPRPSSTAPPSGAGSRPVAARHQGRHASLQVRGQSHPHPPAEPPAPHRADRVPLRIPRLPGRHPAPHPVRAQLQRLPLRHRDLHPVHPGGHRPSARSPSRTHYGDEQCRVNGLSYARHVLSQTFRSKLHDKGLFYERKFDVASRVGPVRAQDRLPQPHDGSAGPGRTPLDRARSGVFGRAPGPDPP